MKIPESVKFNYCNNIASRCYGASNIMNRDAWAGVVHSLKKTESTSPSQSYTSNFEKVIGDFIGALNMTNTLADGLVNKMPFQMKNMFALQRVSQNLVLQTNLISRLSESFSSSIKSLQRAAGGQ